MQYSLQKENKTFLIIGYEEIMDQKESVISRVLNCVMGNNSQTQQGKQVWGMKLGAGFH